MTIVKVEGLSKEYVIGGKEMAPQTLREAFSGLLRSPIRKLRSLGSAPPQNERFFALQDVSFEVQAGEALGIIGKNGAGKSTLLKILSEVTRPTAGRIELCGRVSSLLEVGIGFHPELTGRENVYLNGVIMGMSRAEVRTKFDEIVAFSEIDRFIDTPVKRYSSGMYVRLAFAVAAHLDPDILIMDEVLAVGDAMFQKKCLKKVEEVGSEGRTVLLVSHNMAAVRQLCRRVLWLEDGRIRQEGKAVEVADEYLQESLPAESLADIPARIAAMPPDPLFRLKEIGIRQQGRPCNVVLNGLPVEIEIRYRVFERVQGLRVFFDLCDEDGTILIRSFHDDDADAMSDVPPGEYGSTGVIPADLLSPRIYELRIYGAIYNQRTLTPGGIRIPLHVERSSGINRGYPYQPIRSRMQPRIAWTTAVLRDGTTC